MSSYSISIDEVAAAIRIQSNIRGFLVRQEIRRELLEIYQFEQEQLRYYQSTQQSGCQDEEGYHYGRGGRGGGGEEDNNEEEIGEEIYVEDESLKNSLSHSGLEDVQSAASEFISEQLQQRLRINDRSAFEIISKDQESQQKIAFRGGFCAASLASNSSIELERKVAEKLKKAGEAKIKQTTTAHPHDEYFTQASMIAAARQFIDQSPRNQRHNIANMKTLPSLQRFPNIIPVLSASSVMNNQNKHLQNGVQQRPVRDASTMENQSELKKNKDILIVEGITYDHRVNDVNQSSGELSDFARLSRIDHSSVGSRSSNNGGDFIRGLGLGFRYSNDSSRKEASCQMSQDDEFNSQSSSGLVQASYMQPWSQNELIINPSMFVKNMVAIKQMQTQQLKEEVIVKKHARSQQSFLSQHQKHLLTIKKMLNGGRSGGSTCLRQSKLEISSRFEGEKVFSSDTRQTSSKKVLTPATMGSNGGDFWRELWRFGCAATAIQRCWRGYRSRCHAFCGSFPHVKQAVRVIEKQYLEFKQYKVRRMRECLRQVDCCSYSIVKMVKDFEKGEALLKKSFRKKNFDVKVAAIRSNIVQVFCQFIANHEEIVEGIEKPAENQNCKEYFQKQVLRLQTKLVKQQEQHKKELSHMKSKYEQLKDLHKETIEKYIQGIKKLSKHRSSREQSPECLSQRSQNTCAPASQYLNSPQRTKVQRETHDSRKQIQCKAQYIQSSQHHNHHNHHQYRHYENSSHRMSAGCCSPDWSKRRQSNDGINTHNVKALEKLHYDAINDLEQFDDQGKPVMSVQYHNPSGDSPSSLQYSRQGSSQRRRSLRNQESKGSQDVKQKNEQNDHYPRLREREAEAENDKKNRHNQQSGNAGEKRNQTISEKADKAQNVQLKAQYRNDSNGRVRSPIK